MTSYEWILNNNNLPPILHSDYWCNFHTQQRVFPFNALTEVNPQIQDEEISPKKITIIPLWYGANRILNHLGVTGKLPIGLLSTHT